VDLVHTYNTITIGWLGGIGGPIRTLRKSFENDKGERQHNKQGSKNLQVILLMLPNIVDSNSRTTHEEGQRSPLTGTIDGIRHDVKRIGISHIIFGFNFSPIRADIYDIIAITKVC
jgi:hypothetical protein